METDPPVVHPGSVDSSLSLEFNAGRPMLEGTAAVLELRVLNKGPSPLRLTKLAVTNHLLNAPAKAAGLTLAPGKPEIVYLQVCPRTAGRLVLDLSVVYGPVAGPGQVPPGPEAWRGRLPLDVFTAAESPAPATHLPPTPGTGDQDGSGVGPDGKATPSPQAASPAGLRDVNDLLRSRSPECWTVVSLHADDQRTAVLRPRAGEPGPAARRRRHNGERAGRY